MKNKAVNLLKFFIGWPLTIIALFFVIKFIAPNVNAVAVAIHTMNFGFLFAGILSIVIYLFIRSFFWKYMLQQKHINVSWKEMNWIWGASEFQRYVPGNIWTFLGRATFFSEKKISKKDTLSLFLLEAEFIVVSCLFLSLLCLNFLVYGMLPVFNYKPIIIVGIIIITIAFIFSFLANYSLLKSQKLRTLIKIDLLPHYAFKINLQLFVIQTAAMFFFGLGTYFSISTLSLLYPLYVSTFIGFFVFSLLVGYLSFITPMGLGIREGVITAGLAKFMMVSLAGFSALFARVIFVFSELIFLLLAFGWYKTKNIFFLRTETYIKMHWQTILLFCFITIYSIYMISASFARYDNFYAGRFDLGNMDQTVWNTIHGRVFQMTDANGTEIISRLSAHADFILVLLAPFYLLWQDPKMLLLIQTLVLAAGAIFVYLIAKDTLKNRTIALIFAISYLVYPSINYTNLYDFHAVTLATTFLLGAFYFFKRQKYIWYILFLVLAGLTKEEVWIIVSFFGIYTILSSSKTNLRRNKVMQCLLGLGIFLGALGTAYYLISYAIPHARGGGHFALQFYSDFGSSPLSIIKTVIFQPQKTVATILQPGQLTYLLELFSPLGFLSLFNPWFLLFALPDLAIDLLSNSDTFHQIYYQYPASITPFIFISSLYGFKIFTNHFPKLKLHTTYYLILTTVISAYFFGPLPGSHSPNLVMFDSPLPYASEIDEFLSSIPKKYSIAATNNVGSHLSHRQKIFTIPIGIDQADIVVFLLNDPFAQPSLKQQKLMAKQMKEDKRYIEVFKEGDFVVFEKRNLYIEKEPNLTREKLFPLSLPALQHRDYVGGMISIDRITQTKSFASVYQISYPSDGLMISATMEVPITQMPPKNFPVLILNYDTTPQNTLMDYFAKKGFLVIQPQYRTNSVSPTDVPLAYPIDIIQLISSLSNIPQADSKNIFLWGQGIGGEATIKTLEIIGDTKDTELKTAIHGAVVWAPIISPSEWPSNLYESIENTIGSPARNLLLWQSITAKNYLDDVHTPLEIDQGTDDLLIPYTSSIELYNDLVSYNKNVVLRLIPNADHNLTPFQSTILQKNTIFFEKHLQK